jgi:hypothetical protein
VTCGIYPHRSYATCLHNNICGGEAQSLYERYSYYQVHTYLALPSALTSMKLCHCGVPQGFTVFPWM